MVYKKTPARLEAVANTADKNKKIDKERRKEFGQRMKAVRLGRDMTQMDMAIATGQAYFTFISQIENGVAKVPSRDVALWAAALDLNVADFAKSYLKACDENLFNAIFPKGERATVL